MSKSRLTLGVVLACTVIAITAAATLLILAKRGNLEAGGATAAGTAAQIQLQAIAKDSPLKIPAYIDQDVPVFPGSRIMSSSRQKDNTVQLQCETTAPVEEVAAWYNTVPAQADWKPAEAGQGKPTEKRLAFTKQAKGLSVIISANSSKTIIRIIVAL